VVSSKEIDNRSLSTRRRFIRDSLARAARERFPGLRPHLFNEDGTLHHSTHILLDGRDFIYTEQKEKTPINKAERIDIFPPVGGGQAR